MILEGKDIYLRSIEESDTDNIIAWRNKPDVRKYFINQELLTIQNHTNWLRNYVETGRVRQFIIVSRKDGKGIGSVFLRDIDVINKKAEFGIFIGEEEYLGCGFGTQALGLIMEYGFQELHLNKIFLRVLADNVRAIKSYQKSGFSQEGYFRKDVFVNSELKDLIFMAKLRDE